MFVQLSPEVNIVLLPTVHIRSKYLYFWGEAHFEFSFLLFRDSNKPPLSFDNTKYVGSAIISASYFTLESVRGVVKCSSNTKILEYNNKTDF